MIKLIKKLISDKKQYKYQMEKIEKMPDDYKFVFKKISGYMWSFAGGDGSDMLKLQDDLIELFETGIAENKHVLEITGKDVASFCDELLKSTKTYTGYYKNKLNNEIKRMELK